jgi:GT2 family glycosyltransferase
MSAPANAVPRVDVVVVSYNGRHNLEYSLPSLMTQDYGNFGIFVADNASTDGTAEWLREAYPAVHVMSIGANVGMAAMNRVLTWPAEQGLPRADYVFVAGWDLVFDSRCIRHAVEILESQSDIGVLGFRVLGLFEWEPLSNLAQASAELSDTVITDTNWVPGACSVLRRDVLDIAGFIDPAYFAYAEEDDLQFRFRNAGYRTVLLNTPCWQNAREAAIPLPRAAYLTMRNSVRFAIKNFGVLAGLRQAVKMTMIACGPRVITDGSRVQLRSRPYSPFRNSRLVVGALIWNLWNLRSTLVARRESLRRIHRAAEYLKQHRQHDSSGSSGARALRLASGS